MSHSQTRGYFVLVAIPTAWINQNKCLYNMKLQFGFGVLTGGRKKHVIKIFALFEFERQNFHIIQSIFYCIVMKFLL